MATIIRWRGKIQCVTIFNKQQIFTICMYLCNFNGHFVEAMSSWYDGVPLVKIVEELGFKRNYYLVW